MYVWMYVSISHLGHIVWVCVFMWVMCLCESVADGKSDGKVSDTLSHQPHQSTQLWLGTWHLLGCKFKAFSHKTAMVQVGLRVPTPLAVRKGLFSCEFLARLQELCLHGSQCLLSAQASWLCQVCITLVVAREFAFAFACVCVHVRESSVCVCVCVCVCEWQRGYSHH